MTARLAHRAGRTADPTPSTRPARTDPHRRIGGLALIGAPAFLLASELVYRGTNDPATLVSDAVRHRAAISVAVILLLVSAALTVPAAATVLRLARERGRNLARVAVVLCTLGALGHAAYAGFSAIQLATAGGDARQMTQLLQRANHSPLMAPLAVCIESFAVGMLCLAFAAHRAGVVGRATPIAMSAAFAVEAANLDSVIAGAAKEGLGLLAFGLVGLAVLRMDDRTWRAHHGQGSPHGATEPVPSEGRQPASPYCFPADGRAPSSVDVEPRGSLGHLP